MSLLVTVSRVAMEWTASLAGHLWQATLFAALVILLSRALRRAPARLRYNLYLLAPLKFLLPSAVLFALIDRLGGDVRAWVPSSWVAVFDFQRALGASLQWLGLSAGNAGGGESSSFLGFWILAAWLGGALTLGFVWRRRLKLFRCQLDAGRVDVPDWVATRLEAQRRRISLCRPVSLTLSSRVAEPGVWGIRKPIIVLPEAMAENLEGDELDAVLLHELIHVERQDNLVGQGLMILRCLLWFHPLLWWLDRRLLAERERACDERVVEVAGNPEAYLRGLAKVVRFGLGARWAGVSLASGSDLRLRIQRLRKHTQPAVSPVHRGIFLVALGLMAASSLGAPRLCAEGEPLEKLSGKDTIDSRRGPAKAAWPSLAACAKPPLPAAVKSPPDCDGLRRM